MGEAPDYSDDPTPNASEPVDDVPATDSRWQERRWLRALAWVSGSLAVLILITSSAGYLLYRYYNGRIGHFQVVIHGPRPAPAVAGTTNTLWDLSKLVKRLRSLDAGKMHFETLPTRPLSPTDPGAFYEDHLLQLPAVGSVLLSDPDALEAFLAPLKDQPGQPISSTTATAHPTPTVPLTVPPSAIQVTVQNGTTVTGLARQVSRQLTEAHFVVGAPETAPRSDIQTTVVTYSAEQREAARTLAAALPGAELRRDDSVGTSLVVVLGSNFRKVANVTLGGITYGPTQSTSAGSSASPTMTPSPPPATPITNAATTGTCADPVY